MKKIILDSQLYNVSDEIVEALDMANADCCGSCNEEALSALREICLNIKSNKPHNIRAYWTPELEKEDSETLPF